MAYKTIQSLEADVVVALGGANKKTGKKNPTQVEGYFLGSREVENKKAKSGKSYIYFFQTDAGNVGVWSKTDLERKMASAKLGNMTRVTFAGMRETPNGDMYTFKVEQDDTNTIDVPELSAGSSTVGGNDYADEDQEYINNEDPDDSNPDDEDLQQTAALAAVESESAKKLKSLLARKNKSS